MTHPTPDRVAVVGSGVAGLLAAHVLTRGGSRVTLYEADHRVGGHADTHDVETGDPAVGRLGVDTGFIVHNHRTYPHLLRLFDELGVATQESEMSMSVRADDRVDRRGGLEYAGALGASGLFPTWQHALRPRYLRMLAEVPRFHRMAGRLLDETDRTTQHATSVADDGETLGQFLDRGGFTPLFRTHFMESLVACVWSCDPAVALEYPARYLFSFLRHHGMLGIFGSPTWRTVTGGSREYVTRVAAGLADVRTGTKVTSVAETATGVEVTDGNGAVETFDAVVLATHPHQTLAMLAEPTPVQREVLAAMAYSPNTAQLHTDTSVLPRLPRARASWNYLRRPAAAGRTVTVTYDMTRLMRLPVPADGTRYLVTLGGTDLVDQDRVIETMQYEHPIYTPASVAAQRRLPECDSDRVVLAGAYHGWGFHEDGARSGVDAARKLGVEWGTETGSAAPQLPPREPTAYATTIRHTRRRPFRRSFEHRSTTWLVDLDHLPAPAGPGGVLGSFEARDHLGDPAGTLKGNVEHFLRTGGVEPDGGRIVMAANARALGHVFNPISVFWCHRRDGALAAVVVEVHNTYGDRHAYLVHPDAQGRARTEKQMYVSPFHGTDGWYDVAVPVPGERLHVAVTLHTDDGATFSASLDGARTPVSALRAAPAALRHTVLIHVHGLWLWARRLGVRPRPEHPRQEGVTR
ncbi:FAD-dependent oxidoreductase [Nocardioides aurantiacus]|uniref:FAD-dependent oxidoreductase n=1 Tax=Nocardioides aurantiacus TaxID=86796 RepID=UPI00403F684C